MLSFQQWINSVFLFLFVLVPTLRAQEKTKELPKEIVVSDKDPLLQKTELIKIITKEDINKDTPYLSYVLKRVNGIRINETGGIGQYTTALIRGSSNQQIKIYKNGIPLSESRYGTVDLSKISLANVESIEIYKGFVPATLGSSNMGAAINIITNKNNENEGVNSSANAIYGSFDSYLFSTNVNEANPKYQINFNIDFVKAKNNYQYQNDRGTPYNSSDDSTDHKMNNAFQELNIQNEVSKNYDNYQVSFSCSGKSGEQELGGPQSSTIKEAKNTFNDLTLNALIKNKNNSQLNWESSIFTSMNSNLFSDALGEIGFSPDLVRNTLYSIGNKNYLHWNITDAFYTNILCEPKEELNKKTDKINLQDSYWTRKSIFLTLEPGIKLWQEKLEIKSGLSFLYNADKVNKFNQDEIEKTNSLFNLQLSAKYISNSNDLFKTSVGKVYRAPSLFELFGDTGLVVGNQQLQNESTLFGEFSWERSFPIQPLRLTADFLITGFVKKGIDFISYQQISTGIIRPFNIEETLITGIETELFFLHSNFDLLFQYTFTDAENKSKDSFKSNKTLPGIPLHQFLTEATIKYRKFKWFYRIHYSSKEYFDEINLIYENDRILMDTGIAFTNKNWQFELEIKNLGNKQYEDFLNYPLPGRSFWLKINYQF